MRTPASVCATIETLFPGQGVDVAWCATRHGEWWRAQVDGMLYEVPTAEDLLIELEQISRGRAKRKGIA